MTGTLGERDGGTAVSVRTDLTVTGRPAQFGRRVMAEVRDRLVGQSAACLAERPAEPAGSAAAGDRQPQEPLDLFRTGGVPVVKRAAGAGVGPVLVTVCVRRWRRAPVRDRGDDRSRMARIRSNPGV
ncbi:hypothetical protein ACIBU0_00175 [Streptomyces sp. NPDC049627]|uniref:hypothetical protein n=1 Tax=Streptomyces sp. NPDC049627 TaxID=3365595 RepID=UPI003787E566